MLVMDVPNPSDWLTVPEAAHALGVTPRTVIRWSQSLRTIGPPGRRRTAGEAMLKIYAIGHVQLCWRADVAELIAARRRAGLA
jgi:hypothetical protein